MESKRSYSSEEEQSRKRLAADESDSEMSGSEEELSSNLREERSSSSSEKLITSPSDSSLPSNLSTSSSRQTIDSSGSSRSTSSISSTNVGTGFPDLDKSDIDFLEQINYRIIKMVGSGAFGNVYQACIHIKYPYISKDRETVAIKVLKEGKQCTTMRVIDRLIDTTYRLIQVEHENIVANYSYAQNFDGYHRLYIINELAELPDLMGALQIKNRLGNEIWWALDEYQARYLIRGIARGVAHMHRIGMSHSDLKLDNILLFWSNNATQQQRQRSISDILTRDKYLIYEWIPKLTDFDKCMVKKANDPKGKIMTRLAKSNVNYGSPESYRGIEYDLIKADCYSVGCCLMAMLLASHPFEDPMGIEDPYSSDPNYGPKYTEYKNRCNQLKADINYIKELIKHLSPELRRVLEKLLDPNSETRITMNQFLADQWFSKTEQLYQQKRYTNFGQTYAQDI